MALSSSQDEQPIRLVRAKQKQEEVKQTRNVRVGKDVLELITGAMYVDPLTIFREYSQNAADALDNRAEQLGGFEPEIRISLNLAERAIRIRDNGIGVPNGSFVQTLTSIGDSPKRGTAARGFRGIGRLSGLGYCRELVFRSASKNDSHTYEMRWDGLRFKQILRDTAYVGDLDAVIRDVVQTKRTKGTVAEPFFEVELLGVVRVRNDSLLNLDSVRDYLCQVAPVPFGEDFRFASEIEKQLANFGIRRGYRTIVQEIGPVSSTPEEIVKPYRDEFAASANHRDTIDAIRFVEVPGLHEGVAAVGWIAEHAYLGALPKSELIGGLRIRHGDIQIGASDILSGLFPEPRFNSWAIGEIHIVSHSIVPNGRRDDFEENAHHLSFQGHLVPMLKDVARACRQKSAHRQWARRFAIAEKAILDELSRLETESVSKRQTTELLGWLNDQCLRLIEMAGGCRFHDQTDFMERAEGVATAVRRVSATGLSDTDPLEAVPYAKRLAFQEVLQLIYEYSGNREVSRKLVSSITHHLAAKHKDR